MTNLIDVLALELREELVETALVGVNTDGGENTLDVGGGGGGVATEAEEEKSGEVLHCESSNVQKKRESAIDLCRIGSYIATGTRRRR